MATFGFQSAPSVSPTATNATFSWVNLNPGDGQAYVGLTADNLNIVNNDGVVGVLSHVVTDPDPFSAPLTSATQYYYSVKSTNDAGVVVAACDPTPFFTMGVLQGTILVQPSANPRRVSPRGASLVSVMVQKQGAAVAGVQVVFTVTQGVATVGPVGQAPVGNSVTVLSDGNGLAQAAFLTGAGSGIVKVTASSPNTSDSHAIPVAVEGN